MSEIVITEFMDEAAIRASFTGRDVLYDPKLVDNPARLTAALRDARALIVKVERPGVGDPARILPGFFRQHQSEQKEFNTGSQETRVWGDLPASCGKVRRRYRGVRPGVARHIGMDYERLRKINPRLIYCSISGYGQKGPYCNLPGHDLNYMAMSGMLGFFKDTEGNLIIPGIAIGDLSSGMFAAIGIMAALAAREKTGRGQLVDVSMFDGLFPG